jgi:hypothetical protein
VGNAQCLAAHAAWRSFLSFLYRQTAIVPAAALAPYLAAGAALPDAVLADHELGGPLPTQQQGNAQGMRPQHR